MEWLPLFRNGRRAFSLHFPPGKPASPLVHAAAIFEKEIAERAAGATAARIPGPGRGGGLPPVPIRVVCDAPGPSSDAFDIAAAAGKEGGEIRIASASPRGAAYGLFEILDRLETRGAAAGVRPFRAVRRPVFERRAMYRAFYRSPREVRDQLLRAFRLRLNACYLGFGFERLLSYKYLLEGPRLPEAPARRNAARLRPILDLAKELGTEVHLVTKEFMYPPGTPERIPGLAGTGSRICFTSPAAARLLDARYREIFERAPGIRGLYLLLSEGQATIFECRCPRCRRLSPADRVRRLAFLLRAIGRKIRPEPEFTLYLYLSGYRNVNEFPWFRRLRADLPPNVAIGLNGMASDTFITHPPNPLLPALPRVRKTVDFDLYGEYFGLGDLPYNAVPYLRRYLRHARRAGAFGVSARIGYLFLDTVFDSWNEVSLEGFARLSWDLGASPARILRDWVGRRFSACRREIADIFSRVNAVIEGTLHANRLAINSHSHPPESLTRFWYILRDFSAPFFKDGARLAEVTPANFDRMIREKETAVRLARRLFLRVEALDGRLPHAEWKPLEIAFYNLLQTARVWRHLLEAVLSCELFFREKSQVRREQLRERILEAVGRCESQCWLARTGGAGYAFGILNEIRTALRAHLAPWSGFVPTSTESERAGGRSEAHRSLTTEDQV